MSKQEYKVKRVSGMPVADTDLISDLKGVAERLGKETVGQKEYRQHGKYDDTTVSRRFGSWNAALQEAGLVTSNEPGLSDERLFENILRLWQNYGRQPRRAELSVAPSKISQSPYTRRFGSWSAALSAFADYANANPTTATQPPADEDSQARRETGRDPSLRLRWRVLQRDRFTCCGCGASPAITPGVELHVDHMIPWSKGGLTISENLRTLCSRCNLGKSDTVA
jgi:hypothetical protein